MDTYRVPPHGGKPVHLIASQERIEDLKKLSRDIESITLTSRQISDLELLMNGAFSPLRGFMKEKDYIRVTNKMQLENGLLWPVPVNLDIPEEKARDLRVGQLVALRDNEGFMIAVIAIEDIYSPDRHLEAEKVYGTRDISHPGVKNFLAEGGTVYIGGTIEGIQFPLHFAFRRFRHTPAEIRSQYQKLGWRRIVGFHTRNPLHRAQYEMTLSAMAQARANLLLHPVVMRVRPGDIDTYTRVRCYQEVADKYPPNMMMLSLLPLYMRMAGPKEAILHAIVRKNYGCTHFVIGQNHACPHNEKDHCNYYEKDESIRLAESVKEDLGIELVSFDKMVYVREEDAYMPESSVDPGDSVDSLSDDEFHRRIRLGKRIPAWYSFPEVITTLQAAYPPRHRQGVTIFCTGLSGAGKSTIARVLYARFLEMGARPVTLLDGDIVRQNLSNELGFSREHRNINVKRIGFVASEITKNRGIAICAPIAPYAETRTQIRDLIETYGGFVEVHVATPVSVCEGRDRKGLYAKARAGMIKGFTGVDDPYEAPEKPEVRVDTTDMTPDEAAQEVLLYLERAGYIK